MKTTIAALLLAACVGAAAQTINITRVADDAKAIDRVAEASKRDLPGDLLIRIVEEDIEILRGKRSDGTYQYAAYEKLDSGRVSDSFSVQPEKENNVLELRGNFVYRLVMSAPSRRMMVTRNKRVFVDRVEIEYIPEKETTKRSQSVKIDAWIEPGTSRSVELDGVVRQATAKVHARADAEGYGNLVLTFIQGRVFDDPTSPYADAVASEKAILKAIRNNDVPSIRAMAKRVANSLQPTAAAAVAAVPVRPEATVDVTAPKSDPELLNELQAIEDLLTGTEAERRQGLDRLHQLVRRLRTPSR